MPMSCLFLMTHIQGCLFRYGNSSVWNNIDGAVELFQEYCQGYHDIYQRPLWVTEFGLADYGNATNGYNGYFPSTDLQVGSMS